MNTAVPAGLAAGRLGTRRLTSFAVGASAPMTVLMAITVCLAVTGNLGSPLGYLAVAVVLVLFAFGYTAMSRRVINTGAFYAYLTHGLGRFAGVTGGAV